MNTLEVYAYDAAGNQASGRIAITLDVIAPVAAVTSPANGTTVSEAEEGSNTIILNAYDVAGNRGQRSFQVTRAGPVAFVTISPTRATLQVGGSRQFTATATDSRGRVVPSKKVQWKTSDAAIATVSDSGVVTGVRSDVTLVVITATIGGVSNTATVNVTR